MNGEIENTKQQDILKTAHKLFWKHGIRRVSVEEICREAGVSKMTFYKFYPNKIELAKSILENLINASIEKFRIIIESDIAFSEKMKEIFLMKIEGTNNMSIEFINDIYSNPGIGLKEYLDEQYQKSIAITVDFYKRAKENGFIRADVKINFILALSNQIMEMMKNKELIAQYNNPQDFIIESMNVLFYGITTGNE